MTRKQIQKQAAETIIRKFTDATRVMTRKGAWQFATLNHSPAAIGLARLKLDKHTQGVIA